MTAPDPIAPVVDRDSQPWWDALGRHELLLQRCADCGRARWPARALCNRCGSLHWGWTPATGAATVASWIVTHHAFGPAWPTPYVVVLASLDDQEDLLIPGAYDGSADGQDLAIGMALLAGFDDVTGSDGRGWSLLRWRRR